ncbi:NTP transferase domain-containing protein [Nocardioides marmoraquaticus]
MVVGVVVLTGGTGRRLGGADKAGLTVGGRSLLSRALSAASGLGPVVVVGPFLTGVPATFVREDPPGGGPAAALLAGVAALPEVDLVVVLAVDMPLVASATLERLVGAVGPGDGALLVDGDGREQYLCAAYSRAALLAAAPADVDGLPLRRLVAGLSLAPVPAVGDEALDVDTPGDLDLVRRLAGG